MWAATQALVSYAEALGTIFVVGALIDWMLVDRQRRRIADGAARLWGLAGAARRRWVAEKLGRRHVRRAFLAAVFLGEALVFSFLARRMGYGSRAANAGDVLIGDLLLFVAPFCLAAVALIAAGPRLIAALTDGGNLLACTAKCLTVALAADVAGYGALRAMDATFALFGPRALIDWWDPRLWVYAAEYAVSGVIVSAMAIAHLLLAICAVAGVATLALVLGLLQAEALAGVIRRYPRQPLLGSSIALAGLAVMAKQLI